MKILLTGATGFLGRALVLRLAREGHEVVAWVRDLDRARGALGQGVRLLEARAGHTALAAALSEVDAVVNLAGAPVAGGRFTRARRAALEESRVGVTHALIDAMATATRRPRVLISASAIGLYGDRGDEVLDEGSARGTGFLAELCERWERAAGRAEALGVRLVVARIGVVLGLGGGYLGALLPLFQAGLGARFGDGRQWLSFIHIDDLLEAMAQALVDERYVGPFNLVAPEPVRAGDLATALAAALGRRQRIVAPAGLLRAVLGEAAGVVLASQRVLPARLAALGFRFAFRKVSGALSDLVGLQHIEIGAAAASPGGDYLRARPPRYLLRSKVELAAPLSEVFAFFSRPENLGLITPAAMSFQIRRAPPAIETGATIDYGLRVAGAPLRWQSRIEGWTPERSFVDAQTHGPYRSWWHEHHFRAEGGSTVMEDRVYYAPPLGLLGRVAQALFVAPQLRHIFGYRRQAIRQRFAPATTAPQRG
jgi:uncharacterized protein (TIGR01777 family)